MDEFPDIPSFLRLTAEQRRQGWLDHPPYVPTARPLTEAERERKADDMRKQALKRALDEQRWAALREKANADKAERAAVARAVRQSRMSKGDL